ncbi:M48 family metallopeptidase [Oceanobacillus jordanicus]|uniref:M48 family metallopeptidase n=1 Tax=Oceanobacillus jordanicus TaxID=2867266 RepID=A0AAW5B007_9BACI|nr:SprT family zinc-dependent metalloprotease [Oceanobacillus jordanicus]MCG3417553.1 M48 family metallopeptidase [Oceanobacillus jordanicus]
MSSEAIIGGMPIEIIKKKNLKNLYIRVNPPEGNVTVSTPSDYPDEEIRLFVLKKMPEITKVRDRMLAQPRQTEREYVSGESHYLWGKPYRLQVVYEGNKYEITKLPNKIILTAPERSTKESRESAFNEWYREELKRVLNGVISTCESKTNLHANEYKIKNMRTKWGACNINKKRIWINLQLAKKPVECLEYVVIHELVHLIEKNHTNRFHALVEEFYPTWKEARKLLAEMPLDYIEKGEG